MAIPGHMATFDGKDEESSSEDSMSSYAIKVWGRTTGTANMEARGDLQLDITARSLQSYFLYFSSNTVKPSKFIYNKASGILFEKKIDHYPIDRREYRAYLRDSYATSSFFISFDESSRAYDRGIE